VIENLSLKLISPPAFLLTKIAAFQDRGASDYYGSRDMEDLLTVIDGRRKISDEIAAASPELVNYISQFFDDVLTQRSFQDALPGHLPADSASQARLPGLRAKLITISSLS
jgi:hypothetical protein